MHRICNHASARPTKHWSAGAVMGKWRQARGSKMGKLGAPSQQPLSMRSPLHLLRLRHRCLHLHVRHALQVTGDERGGSGDCIAVSGCCPPSPRSRKQATEAAGPSGRPQAPAFTHLAGRDLGGPGVQDPGLEANQVAHADRPLESDLVHLHRPRPAARKQVGRRVRQLKRAAAGDWGEQQAAGSVERLPAAMRCHRWGRRLGRRRRSCSARTS